MGGTALRYHRAVGTREDSPRFAGTERTYLNRLHVPDPGLGGRAHEFGRGLPDLLSLLVIGKSGEGTAGDLLKGDVLLLRHGSHGQEEAELEGSHGLMTSSGEG